MRKPTALIANSDLLKGNKLYQIRAREALPILVRQANAQQPIYYSDLANELKMPNPRNLNYVLGSIGTALIKLEKTSNIKIPPIQCLVINKSNNLPGKGIKDFIRGKNYSMLTTNEKRLLVKEYLREIFIFKKWVWVLKQFNLSVIESDIEDLLNKAGRIRGNGGESKEHKEFKFFISKNPSILGLSSKLAPGKMEQALPSADKLDVRFSYRGLVVGIEVKSKKSNKEDIIRGIFQCVKYRHLIEAEQMSKGERPNGQSILALEGKLPQGLYHIKNILGVKVVENARRRKR